MKYIGYLSLLCCLCLFSELMNGMAEHAAANTELVAGHQSVCKKQLVGMQEPELDRHFAMAQKLDILRISNPLLFAQLCVFLRLTDRSDALKSMQKRLNQYGLDPNDPDLGSVLDKHLVGEGLDMRFQVKVRSENESVPVSDSEKRSLASGGVARFSEGA